MVPDRYEEEKTRLNKNVTVRETKERKEDLPLLEDIWGGGERKQTRPALSICYLS